jgi:transposase
MTKTRRKIDAGLKAKIALEALREQRVARAARAFDPGLDAEAASAREIEKLHAKISQLTIENDFFARRSGKWARRTAEPSSIARMAICRSAGNVRCWAWRAGRLSQAATGQ